MAGYVLKGGTVDDLCNAIKGVLKGETFIPPALLTKVISGLRNAALQKAAGRAIKLKVFARTRSCGFCCAGVPIGRYRCSCRSAKDGQTLYDASYAKAARRKPP